MKKLNVYVSSNMGLVRTNNEDMVLAGSGLYRDDDWRAENIILSPKDSYICAVCDGMGGQNAGEIASEDVATQLRKFADGLPDNLDEDKLVDRLRTWQQDEHEYLLQRGLDEVELMGMGTTLVGLIFYHDMLLWMNCGDSRLYRYRDGVLTQLSRDHSLYNITHEMADSHIILNCMGGGCEASYIDVENITNEHVSGDVYVLCSDGLTDMISDQEISYVLSNGGRAKELTNEACAAGGVDNVSVCVFELI